MVTPNEPGGALPGTTPLDPREMRAAQRRIAPVPRVALLLVHQHGVQVHELRTGEVVVVGREPPADVCLEDPSLSRRHASFMLRTEEGRVEVLDLESTNGTWRQGRRVDRASLGMGDDVMLGAVLARVRLLAEPPPESERAPDSGSRSDPVVAGPELSALLQLAERAARSRIAILLLGETGTGKEVIARHVHAASPRKNGPMICVNCGAIPKDLVESTFFGHERGAFTGAHQTQRGVFESAHGGTLFLDEIGELPPSAQAALLRALETGRITRVGSAEERAVDVRLIAATHRDLAAASEKGEFRADLYFRLSAVTLEIPPLRQRVKDIEPLARAFLRAANQTHGRSVEGLTRQAAEMLAAYPWPGNVRELRNVIERAVVLAEGDVIDERDLPDRIRERRRSEPPPSNPRLRSRVRAYEATLIRDALAAAGGSRSEAARALGMPLRTLAHRIKALGLEGNGGGEAGGTGE
ncbi:MAG: sigma 54-interacting transcriptional regulator [Polyangiaceae bacterium]